MRRSLENNGLNQLEMVKKTTNQAWFIKHRLLFRTKIILGSALVILSIIGLSQFKWSGIGADSTMTESVEETEQDGKITSIKRTTTEQEEAAKTLWDVI